jgi:hypothetical protein
MLSRARKKHGYVEEMKEANTNAIENWKWKPKKKCLVPIEKRKLGQNRRTNSDEIDTWSKQSTVHAAKLG